MPAEQDGTRVFRWHFSPLVMWEHPVNTLWIHVTIALETKILSFKASIETLPDSIDKLGYAFPCLNNTQMNYKLMKWIILHLSVKPNILSQHRVFKKWKPSIPWQSYLVQNYIKLLNLVYWMNNKSITIMFSRIMLPASQKKCNHWRLWVHKWHQCYSNICWEIYASFLTNFNI